ncbi:MAG TPA: DUF721 domain-containing protein [Acidimicrobiia bacterium]|nr:DUF721 domain-containing protein [Acidimicrobiia bacterium]
MTDDGLRPIGSGLEKMLRDLGMPETIDVAALVDDWPAIAGEPFGSMSTPGSFGDGVLTLIADDGVAASLLKYRVGDLIGRLASRFGGGVVTSVRIRVRGHKKAL